MEPIVIFTRAKICDKPVLKEAKNKTKFYVFTIQAGDAKYPCKCFEDAECFDKMESLHLNNGDYVDLMCSMKKVIQKVKVPVKTEDGEKCDADVTHEVTHFKVKNLDFAIPYEIAKQASSKEKPKSGSDINAVTDLSAFEE